MAAQPDPLLDMVQTFTRHYARAPTAMEVYNMASFRQAGGIGRLWSALSHAAANYKARLDAAAKRSEVVS